MAGTWTGCLLVNDGAVFLAAGWLGNSWDLYFGQLSSRTVAARLRWRLSPMALTLIAVFGLWFAAAGTGVLTWLYARHTGSYMLALATALALDAQDEMFLKFLAAGYCAR
jgi:hypothetical protein